MFTKQNSLGIFGMDAYTVSVEVDNSEGQFAFTPLNGIEKWVIGDLHALQFVP